MRPEVSPWDGVPGRPGRAEDGAAWAVGAGYLGAPLRGASWACRDGPAVGLLELRSHVLPADTLRPEGPSFLRPPRSPLQPLPCLPGLRARAVPCAQRDSLAGSARRSRAGQSLAVGLALLGCSPC